MPAANLGQAQIKRYGIALTGGIGTGKSTVGRLLAQRGFAVIDADQLARGVTAPGSPGLAAVAAHFGSGVLAADATLDRAALGRLVFSQPARRLELEQITHPLIRSALQVAVAALDLQRKPQAFFYEAALIFEINSADHYAQVWATCCAPELQIARVMQRDGIDATRAQQILANQMPAAEKARRADQVIYTDGSLASVAARVEDLIAGLKLS